MQPYPLNRGIQYDIIYNMSNKPYIKSEPKFIITCEICSKKVKSVQPNKKTCSRECMQKRNSIITGRYSSRLTNLSSGTVGAISELLVCSDLMKKGYSVFRALSASCFCDAIAMKGDETLKVEIRTGYINPLTNNLQFPSKLSNDSKNIANCFGIYERNSGKILYLDLNKNEILL